MKIAYVSYANVKIDNPERWLAQLSFYTGILEKQFKEHQVISFHSPNQSATVIQNGVEYRFVRHSPVRKIFPFSLNWKIASQNPEVIIVHGLHFGWQLIWLHLQLRRPVKIFVWHHAEKPKRFPKNIIQKLADRFTQGYFFVSKELAQPWVDKKQISSIEKVFEVMEASSPFLSIDKQEARKKIGIAEGLNYLWVGRMDENKDPFTLLKAFQKFSRNYPQAKLYAIFRDGHLLSEIKKLIDPKSVAISLIGEVAHDDLLFWYNSVDFIVSTSHYEGSGIAVCEAMSCGCVPILSQIASFKKMTENEKCGLLFEPGNEGSLYEAFVKSISIDIDQQRNMALQLFDSNLSFNAIAQTINEVISK